MKCTPIALTFLLFVSPVAAQSEIADLGKLADNFSTQRLHNAPFKGDDVPGMEPPGGTRDWSLASIDLIELAAAG